MTQEDRKRLLKYLGVRLSYGAEDKDLLLQDLCGRLPYGVIGLIHNAKGNDCNISIVGGDIDLFSHQFITIKPYLRPMSSMTEEEMDKLAEFHIWNDGEKIFPDCNCKLSDIVSAMNWLSKKMFDYRGLIEKGLALEAPEGMYNLK